MRKWTEAEIAILERMYPHARIQDIAYCLLRSHWSVASKIHDLRLTKNFWRAWTRGEEKRLESLYGSMPVADLAIMFDRPAKAITLRACQIGVAKPVKRWTEGETQRLIRLNRLGWSDEDISLKMDRSLQCIRNRRQRHGIPAATGEGRNSPKTREKIRKAMKRYWRTKRCHDSATGSGSSGSTKRSHHCEIAEPD